MCEMKLIVPPHAERILTGFRLGAERVMRCHVWRVEFWSDHPFPRIFKDGVRFNGSIPEYVGTFANRVNIDILSHI